MYLNFVPSHDKPRPVPFRWFTDESFWKDVAMNVVSFSITALLAYLFAVGTGYVQEPDGRRVAITLAWVTLLSVAAWFIPFYGVRWVYKHLGPKTASGLAFGIAVVAFGVCIFVVVRELT